jgi:wyosine [tRNA(Phe)-imidazoG37] synthetase (radical SAM superfamily)
MVTEEMVDLSMPSSSSNIVVAAHRDHQTSWHDFRYVYPVISRRCHGLSIGINLNPDKACNFDCIYCQVDREKPPSIQEVDFSILEQELASVIAFYKSGQLFQEEPFASAPESLRKLNNIAIAGDGEPTLFRPFVSLIELVAHLKRKWLDRTVKFVLITNAAGLDRTSVQRGLSIMDDNQGDVWVKLDAGTEEYYKQVNRSSIPFERILSNIEKTAIDRPIRIQSLFLKINGVSPSRAELDAYCSRLMDVKRKGGRIKEVQIYTIARPTQESWATPLPEAELSAIADLVRNSTGLEVECYPGSA